MINQDKIESQKIEFSKTEQLRKWKKFPATIYKKLIL